MKTSDLTRSFPPACSPGRAKEHPIHVIERLPDDAPLDEIVYRLYVLNKGQHGLLDVDAEDPHVRRSRPRDRGLVGVLRWSQRAHEIPSTPRAARVVPELGDPTIREIPIHSWRLIYQLRG